MAYIRIIPRDLFNEANLLKCYGQIYINLETSCTPHVVLEPEAVHEPFDVVQDEDSGNLSIANVQLMVNGMAQRLYRPMNSRQPWPLYTLNQAGDEISVFDDTGKFTQELLDYFESMKPQTTRRPRP